VRAADAGWDNAMFRLGEHLAVRLPRRAVVAKLIEHEQQWLPRLAQRLPIAVPAACRLGEAALDYPWRWSVVPWIDGESADVCEPDESQAARFGQFLRSLHIPAPPQAPANPVRGVPLSQRAASAQTRIERLATQTGVITSKLRHIWEEALEAPLDVTSSWLHGDLHSRNVLVQKGVITGVIDWGDITSGDCATDLAAIWMLFAEARVRDDALAAYGVVSNATMLRAKGWAVLFGVLLLDTGLVDNPRNERLGERILRRIVT
jgi:aminoglycoside phosphotransferase (APT) family kinase protein